MVRRHHRDPTEEGQLHPFSEPDLHSHPPLANPTSQHPGADVACDVIETVSSGAPPAGPFGRAMLHTIHRSTCTATIFTTMHQAFAALDEQGRFDNRPTHASSTIPPDPPSAQWANTTMKITEIAAATSNRDANFGVLRSPGTDFAVQTRYQRAVSCQRQPAQFRRRFRKKCHNWTGLALLAVRGAPTGARRHRKKHTMNTRNTPTKTPVTSVLGAAIASVAAPALLLCGAASAQADTN